MNKTLTGTRLLCIMLCARIFTTMTFFPDGGDNAAVLMLAALLSTFLQALMLLPAAIAFDKGRAYTPSKGAMLVYLAFFGCRIFKDIGGFIYFSEYFFTGDMHRTVVLICILAPAVYLAALKTGTVGKAAGAVLISVGAALLIIGSDAFTKARWDNLDLAVNGLGQQVMRLALSETERCECLVMFTFLLPKIKRPEGSAVALGAKYLGLKLGVLLFIYSLTGATLGAYFKATKLPVFSAASYSGGKLIQRFDSVFLLIWCCAGLVKLATLVHLSGLCLRTLMPKISPLTAGALSAAVPAAAALPFLLTYRWESMVYNEGAGSIVGALAIAALTALPPLLGLFKRFTKNRLIGGRLNEQT